MFDAVIRKAASLAISLVLLHVPKAQYEQKIADIPSMEQKNTGFDLKGWVGQKRHSSRLGIDHYFLSYPPVDSNAQVFVLLHGFNTDSRAFVNMHSLSRTHRLIAYDFPWEGECYKGSLDDFVCVLEDFFQIMGFDTVCLGGYSFGGAVAVHFAGSTTKTVVQRLVLIATTVFGATPEDRARNRRMADKLLPYPDYKLFYLIDRARSLAELIDRRSVAERVESDILVMKKPVWYRQVLGSLRDYDAAPFAARITCPVLVLHGSQDRVIPVSATAVTATHLPQSVIVVLEGKGHSTPYLDGEQVADHIIASCPRLRGRGD